MTSPLYIALEGLEGCGKSTHAKRLGATLNAVITREPGGTDIGGLLRAILSNPDNTELHARTEALLMAADRAQHMEQVIRPALNAGTHVVSDRSIYSTLAYQGFGRGLDVDELRRISTWALADRLPDLVIFISVPTDVLNERLAKRDLDRFEREGAEFFARVANGFHTLINNDPSRWITIDGTMPKDDVELAIREAVTARIPGKQ